MDEILPDPAKTGKRMIEPGPSAQEKADFIGAMLAQIEQKKCRAALCLSELRSHYEIECAELGLQPTAWFDLGEFSKKLKEHANSRFRLIVQAHCKREGIVLTSYVMRDFEEGKRKFPLAYKPIPEEKPDAPPGASHA